MEPSPRLDDTSYASPRLPDGPADVSLTWALEAAASWDEIYGSNDTERSRSRSHSWISPTS